MGAAGEPPIEVRGEKKINRVSTVWKMGAGGEPTHPHHTLIYRIGESTSCPSNRATFQSCKENFLVTKATFKRTISVIVLLCDKRTTELD